jgi:hypothetical protein
MPKNTGTVQARRLGNGTTVPGLEKLHLDERVLLGPDPLPRAPVVVHAGLSILNTRKC